MIERIVLSNWRRFRGRHSIDLGPGVYSVVARFEDDPQRSNWAGKSTFIWAIRFAMTGDTPPDNLLADDWITDGESSGYVGLRLAGAVEVVRSRDRGSATHLAVTVGDGEEMRDDAAQTYLDREVTGLGRKDLVATSFLEQGEMSAIVRAEPGDLHRMAASWFGLEKLAQAAKLAGDELAALLSSGDQLRRGLDATLARLDEIACVHADDFEATLASTRHSLEELEPVAEEALARVRTRDRDVARARNAVEHARLVRDGRDLREKMRVVDVDQLRSASEAASEASARARADLAICDRAMREKAAVAGGGFTGACPVMGKACPVADQVRADFEATGAVLAAARSTLAAAQKVADEAVSEHRAALEELAAAERLAEEFRTKRDRARLLAPDKDAPEVPEEGDLREAARTAADKAAEARACLRTLEHALERRDELLAVRAEDEEKIAEVFVRVTLARQVCEVLGRQGAQRIVAEAALAAIREETDGALAEAGIAQRALVSWCRDAASGLATNCGACGTAFPRSQRVKLCERCGATRGPKVVNKLSVRASSPSGAGDDLVGVFFQLSAAAWLRRARGGWPVLAMDEPCGALDAANRAAFSGKIAAMLTGRFGFAQAFVVAHSPEVRDALPNRVEIVADERGSRFERGSVEGLRRELS